MKIKKEKIGEVLDALNQLAEAIEREEAQHSGILQDVHQAHARSARNLVHYLAFRKFDPEQYPLYFKSLAGKP